MTDEEKKFDGTEWEHIPEMVQKGILRPYQDFVYITFPDERERQAVLEAKRQEAEHVRTLLMKQEVYDCMKEFGPLMVPGDYEELFIREPELYKALVSYVKNYGIDSASFFDKGKSNGVIKKWDKELLKASKKDDVPALTGELLQVFLKNIPYETDFDSMEETPGEGDIIANSRSKLEAIGNLTESATSCIVVADEKNITGRESLGTDEVLMGLDGIAVFEFLRRREQLVNSGKEIEGHAGEAGLALLSEDVCILSEQTAAGLGFSGEKIENTDYLYIEGIRDNQGALIKAVIKAYGKGDIRVLVGTPGVLADNRASLLADVLIFTGRDTMQLRNTALNVKAMAPDSTAVIWHLCTLDYNEKEKYYYGGKDYLRLQEEFDTLLGPSWDGERFCSGIDRLGLQRAEDDLICYEKNIDEFMKLMREYAADSDRVKTQWERAMEYGNLSCLRQVMHVAHKPKMRLIPGDERLGEKTIKQLVQALFDLQREEGLISEKAELVTYENSESEKLDIYVKDGTAQEQDAFMKGLKQLLEPIYAPDYILEHGDGLKKKYAAIPDFCKNTELANSFAGKTGLKGKAVYTGDSEGKKLLFMLRAGLVPCGRNLPEITLEAVFD